MTPALGFRPRGSPPQRSASSLLVVDKGRYHSRVKSGVFLVRSVAEADEPAGQVRASAAKLQAGDRSLERSGVRGLSADV